MSDKKTILITGASTGIGEDAAISLAHEGHTVWAGVRKTENGEALRTKAGENLRPLILDVTKPNQIQDAIHKISAAGRLDALINNAGIAVGGPVEFLPVDDFRKQFEVNVFGLLAMTQAALPLLRAVQGRVINIGSISGKLSTPFMGAYSGSKFAVEAISDSLRMELEPWHMFVSLVEPGPIKTPIWQKSKALAQQEFEKLGPKMMELYGPRLERLQNLVDQTEKISIPVSHVTDAIRHALTSGSPKTRYVVGMNAKAQGFLSKFIPDKMRDRLILSRFN